MLAQWKLPRKDHPDVRRLRKLYATANEHLTIVRQRDESQSVSDGIREEIADIAACANLTALHAHWVSNTPHYIYIVHVLMELRHADINTAKHACANAIVEYVHCLFARMLLGMFCEYGNQSTSRREHNLRLMRDMYKSFSSPMYGVLHVDPTYNDLLRLIREHITK